MATEHDIAASINRFIAIEVERRLTALIPSNWKRAFKVLTEKHKASQVENEKLSLENVELKSELQAIKERIEYVLTKGTEKVEQGENGKSSDVASGESLVQSERGVGRPQEKGNNH
jgi:hypothetical protein